MDFLFCPIWVVNTKHKFTVSILGFGFGFSNRSLFGITIEKNRKLFGKYFELDLLYFDIAGLIRKYQWRKMTSKPLRGANISDTKPTHIYFDDPEDNKKEVL